MTKTLKIFQENVPVYDCTLHFENDVEDMEILEMVFSDFQHCNKNCPDDFRGYSLSVGDKMDIDGTLYLCNSFSWDKVVD